MINDFTIIRDVCQLHADCPIQLTPALQYKVLDIILILIISALGFSQTEP